MYSYDEIIRRSRDAVMQEINYFATGGIERRGYQRNRNEADEPIQDSTTFTFIKITGDNQREKITRYPDGRQTCSTLLHIPR